MILNFKTKAVNIMIIMVVQKKKNSQLNNLNGTEEDSAFDHLTSQQKRILLGAIVFGICVVSLWIIRYSENRDLKISIRKKNSED